MPTTGLPASLDLGSSVTAAFLWHPDAPPSALPFGATLRHTRPEGALCRPVQVVWARVAPQPHPVWTLLSLIPLTLTEAITCPRCGRSGWISGGRWVAA